MEVLQDEIWDWLCAQTEKMEGETDVSFEASCGRLMSDEQVVAKIINDIFSAEAQIDDDYERQFEYPVKRFKIE